MDHVFWTELLLNTPWPVDQFDQADQVEPPWSTRSFDLIDHDFPKKVMKYLQPESHEPPGRPEVGGHHPPLPEAAAGLPLGDRLTVGTLEVFPQPFLFIFAEKTK